MPSQRASLKSAAVGIVLFVGLCSLVGHLTLNFWERYIIQSELTRMKTSLQTLKKTITGIGNAYDNLHSELKVIVTKAEMKAVSKEFLQPVAKTRKINNYDKLYNELKLTAAPKADMKPVVEKLPHSDINTGTENEYDNLYNKLKNEIKPDAKNLLVSDTETSTGNVYDNLYKELKVLAPKIETKPVAVSVNHKDLHCCKHKYTLDKEPQQDHEIQTMMTLNKTENFNWNESAGKNATTITKYPLKSTGVGSYISNKQEQNKSVSSKHNVQSDDDGHKCYMNYENCRHDCNNRNHFGVY